MLLNLAAYLLFVSPFDLPQDPEPIPRTFIQVAADWLIDLHQKHLTQIDGPRSHFIPCSSRYMREAISKYGFFKGSLLGLDRLIRENKDPWIYPRVELEEGFIKSDPVP